MRSFCYVADAVRAIALAATEWPAWSVYNVGNPSPISMGALAETIAELAGGLTVRFTGDDSRGGGTGPGYRCDVSRARAGLNWEPTTSLRDGLAETLAYARAIALGSGEQSSAQP